MLASGTHLRVRQCQCLTTWGIARTAKGVGSDSNTHAPTTIGTMIGTPTTLGIVFQYIPISHHIPSTIYLLLSCFWFRFYHVLLADQFMGFSSSTIPNPDPPGPETNSHGGEPGHWTCHQEAPVESGAGSRVLTGDCAWTGDRLRECRGERRAVRAVPTTQPATKDGEHHVI